MHLKSPFFQRNKGQWPQCANFRIFLSFRFYVKSILDNVEVLKIAFFAILGTLNFDILVNFRLLKVQKFIEIKIQSL